MILGAKNDGYVLLAVLLDKFDFYLLPFQFPEPIDRVSIDVLQLPKTARGNRYAVVFMD